jgi:hypothetical protein
MMKFGFLHLLACLLAGTISSESAPPSLQSASFVVKPEVFIHHTPERSFIGPGMLALENGDILMAAPWGRPPTNFEEIAAKYPVPMLYRSTDGGRTWQEQGRMKMEWNLTGLISDGGTSFLRLADGRIAVVFNRHVKGLHGGGTPVIAFSADNGQTWTAARVLIENDDAFYVMNDRLIQLRSGRLVLPVARKVGKTEGDRDEGLAMLSDDAGATWRLSRGAARIEAPRGMAEPCVAELGDGRVLMMARTGLGSLHTSISANGGETWSKPEATTLESACSSLTLKSLPDGRLIVFYNHATPIKAGAFFPRTPLCYAVSEDDGRTWSPPVVVDDEGVANKDRQNIYPSICFTNEGMVVMWSTHGADPKGSFAGQYDAKIGGGKRAILAMPAKAAPKAETFRADVCIYEATPGGIAMAVRAAREGMSVVLVNHNDHLGGILSSGLGVWDTLWEGKRSPIYDEARQAIFDHYRTTYGEDSAQYRDALPGKSGHTNGKFEPKVAERILTALVAKEPRIRVIRQRVPQSVKRDGALIQSVTFASLNGDATDEIQAKVFADCSYEGDLAAVAKVPYRLGREARDEFGESHAGVIFMAPEKVAPSPEMARKAESHHRLKLRKFSGFQSIRQPESTGEADENVQAFNYRTILSSDPANRLPVEKPANYDPEKLKQLEHRSIVSPIPNSKRGWNRPQLVGLQTAYVEADWAGRQKVMDAHWEAAMALLYFLQNDPSVDPALQKSWREFGLAKDEFADNGHRPYEFYVREARRIQGRYVFTQHDAMLAPKLDRAPVHSDSIGVTEWYLDTHACTPRRISGALEEGKMMLDVETFPGQVPYRAILPQGVDNLLVPVCLSSTHVAWGTIRLEPTWMNLCESAGHAAVLAIQNNITPAALDSDLLLRKLAASHVMLSFFNDVDVASNDPRVAAAQYFATKGFFADYNARLDEPLTESIRAAWGRGLAAIRAGALKPMELVKEVHEAESADAKKLDRTRGEALLSMWKAIAEKKAESAPTKDARVPLKVVPVRSSTASAVNGKTFDMVVVGATPGGIACAVRAAREGLSVLLVQHNRHIGGMLINGLMQWDALYGGPRSPLFNEYAGMIEDYYRDIYGAKSPQYQQARYTQTHYPMSRFEPGEAEHLFNQLVSREKNISTLLSHYPAAIERDGAVLRTLTLREYGTTNDIQVTATTYVDATYEGDLAAMAKVPYRVGREAREEYGEPHAGKVFTNISGESGPQITKAGNLNLHLYGHSQGTIDPKSPHTADDAIQGFNYRFCLSNEEGNVRLPDKPPGYKREEYVGYYRLGMGAGLLNGKALFNSALLPGENHAYPEAAWPEREKIIERHKNFALGLMWFLQNDESVSSDARARYRMIGLPLDEFPDNHNIPYEMYVREARRIVGRHVFTELDNRPAPGLIRPPIQSDSIAFTDWPMDSHDCTWNRRPGYAFDGKLILTEESRPAQIPWRSLLPHGVDNLIVPVCLSATHVAWGAVRLEPVWMMTGEAAGVAGALAKKQNIAAGQLDPDLLLRALCEKRHFVSFFNDLQAIANHPAMPAAQYFSTKGFFASYDSKLDAPLTEAVRSVWLDGFKQLQQGTLNAAKLALAVHAAESKESPATNELRADALLRLWKQLIDHP